MDSTLKEFFENNGFEVVEKKTTTQVLIENLLAFSIRGKKDGNIHVTFNMIKDDEEKEILRKRIRGINMNWEKTPELSDVSPTQFIKICEMGKVIKQVIRLSEFREVQSDFTLSVATKDNKTMKWRSNLPTEKHIIDAVFRGSEYTSRSAGLGGLVLGEKDVVLDLGGNIGAFTVDVFDKVKKVYVFEPEDVNFEFLSVNIQDNNANNVVARKAAVVGNDDKERDFYLGKVPYYYSFLVKNNRKRVPVSCVNINDVMKECKPTKMKVDIEGSEWEVLINCKDFGKVNQIIFEYNFDMNGDLKSGFQNFTALKNHLKKHGFDVSEMERDMKSNWNLVFLVNKK